MKRSPGSPSANAKMIPGVGHQRGVSISDPELATHAQMSQDRVAIGEGQPQVPCRAARRSECPPGGLRLEVFGPGEVPAYRSRMEYLHRRIWRPVMLCARPRRTTSTSGSSGIDRAPTC